MTVERVLPVVWFQPQEENRRGNKLSFTLLQAEQWAFKVAADDFSNIDEEICLLHGNVTSYQVAK